VWELGLDGAGTGLIARSLAFPNFSAIGRWDADPSFVVDVLNAGGSLGWIVGAPFQVPGMTPHFPYGFTGYESDH